MTRLLPYLACGLSTVLTGQLLAEQPNIVMIVADDLGWNDVGFHGGEIDTPNIDRLAGESIELNRFYVAPICTPTRAGLLTGRYPHRYGLRNTTVTPWREDGLPPEAETLAEMLAKEGYTNRACIGKWHLGHASRKFHPLNQGFTYFYGNYNGGVQYYAHTREGELDWHEGFDPSYDEGYATYLLRDRAIEFIGDRAADADPFLLYLAFTAPHSPLQAPREKLDKYGYDPEKPSFAEGETRQYGSSDEARFSFDVAPHTGNTKRQTYKAMVSALDDSIGAVLRALSIYGFDENTIVFFCSDNGGQISKAADNLPLRGGKSTVWEGGVRVPATIRWPGRFPAGKRIDEVTAFIDFPATILAAAGSDYEPTAGFDGMNILPLLTGQQQRLEREVYLADGGLVEREWKAVRENLFRIEEDPSESCDVSATHPDRLEAMQERIREYDSWGLPEKEQKDYETGREGFVAPHEWHIPEE